MSTIKSSSEHLVLNADGAGKDIKFQANGVEVSSISSAGVMTATSFAGDGSALTGLKDYMHVRDEKAIGTNGGASLAGVNTRVLNTVLTNTITGASLATNQVTLPAGTYRFKGSAPTYQSNQHKAYLYNITTSALAIAGTSMFSAAVSNTQTLSFIDGRIVIAGTTVFELRHQVSNATVGNGLGVNTNVVPAGVEVYAVLEIFKEA